nr:MAG TPA: hypothetical protein [Caudoviricetes sp.]
MKTAPGAVWPSGLFLFACAAMCRKVLHFPALVVIMVW